MFNSQILLVSDHQSYTVQKKHKHCWKPAPHNFRGAQFVWSCFTKHHEDKMSKKICKKRLKLK